MKIIKNNARRFFITSDIVIILILAIKLCFIYTHNIKKQKQHIIFVTTSHADIRSMPHILYSPGVIEAKDTVSITPQVTAIIKKINFEEGAEVAKGQLLFELDDEQFTANILQAKAVLAKDQVTLLQNEADARRLEELAELEYVTKQQAEQAVTIAVAQTKVVNADLAQLQQAEIQLGYTKIYSPIAGKTGKVALNPGDLTVANSQIPLVTINELNTVLVNFNLTQDQLKTLLTHQKQQTLQVEVTIDDRINSKKNGKLIFIDNNINQQTGTFLLKAEVDNSDHVLWPGMLVTVNLIVAIEEHAVVVPVEAIQIDQQGSFVYCVENNKSIAKHIEVSRQIDNLSVISKGLTGKEEVILTIPPNFKEGVQVQRIDAIKKSSHKKVFKDWNA